MKQKIVTYRTKILVTGIQGIASGSNFLLVILLTRIYGLKTLGIYSMLWVVQVFSMSLHQSAVLSPLVTIWPKTNSNSLWVKFFNYNFIVALLLAIGSFIFTNYAVVVSSKWTISSYSLQIFLLVFAICLHLFNRRTLINLQFYIGAFIADFLVYVPLLFVILFYKPELSTLLYFQVLFIWAGVITGLIALKSRIKIKKVDKDFFKEVSKFSRWLILTSSAQWFSGNFFLIAVGSVSGPAGMGIIRIGQSAMGVFSVLFLAIENRVPFSASKLLHFEGKNSFKKYMFDLFKKGEALIIIGASLVSATSVFIIRVVYGASYENYYWVLILFSLLQIFIFTSTILQITLRTLEKTQIIFVAYVITSLTSIILAFPLVENFGILGAIAGLFLTQIIAIAWYFFNLFKKWKTV